MCTGIEVHSTLEDAADGSYRKRTWTIRRDGEALELVTHEPSGRMLERDGGGSQALERFAALIGAPFGEL